MVVDGHDLSNSACAFDLNAEVGRPPRMELQRDADGCPCEHKDVSRTGAEPETILGRTVPTCPMHGAKPAERGGRA